MTTRCDTVPASFQLPARYPKQRCPEKTVPETTVTGRLSKKSACGSGFPVNFCRETRHNSGVSPADRFETVLARRLLLFTFNSMPVFPANWSMTDFVSFPMAVQRAFVACVFATLCMALGCSGSTDTGPDESHQTKQQSGRNSVSIGDSAAVPDQPAGTNVQPRPIKPEEIPLPPEPPDSEDRAVEELEKIGAKVERNKNGNVSAVSFVDIKIEDGHLQLLEPLPFLSKLDLDGTNVTDEGLARLSGLRHLRQLILYDTKVTGSGLIALEELPRLQELYLNFTEVTDETIAQVVHLKNLTLLHLEGCAVTDKGARLLLELPFLETLNITGTQISDEAVADLRKRSRGLKILTEPDSP